MGGVSMPFEPARPPRALTDEQLRGEWSAAAAWIEQERARERAARARYQLVADEVESKVAAIRVRQREVELELNRRERLGAESAISGTESFFAETKPEGRKARHANLAEAILAIWSLEAYREPMTTQEIAQALPDVGYQSHAADRSLRSTINQALTRLCREGRVRKYRMDGTALDDSDTNARARRYMPVGAAARR